MKNWEKKIDELMQRGKTINADKIRGIVNMALVQQKETHIAAIEEMKIDNPVVQHNSWGEGFDNGFNEAIEGAIEAIKEL